MIDRAIVVALILSGLSLGQQPPTQQSVGQQLARNNPSAATAGQRVWNDANHSLTHFQR
jgi:hypothetical protein